MTPESGGNPEREEKFQTVGTGSSISPKVVAVFSALLLSACVEGETPTAKPEPLFNPQVSVPGTANEDLPVPPTEGIAPQTKPQTVSYVVDEHVVSWTTTFSVTRDGRDAGKVVKAIVAMTPTYTYSSPSGDCLAMGKRALVSLGSKVEIEDCSGGGLGIIHENVMRTMFGGGIKTSYRIMNPAGVVIAQSEGTKFLATSFDVDDADGEGGMHARRPWINMAGDKWTMSIGDSDVDERVYVLLVAFKTDADNEREKEEREKEERESD